MGKLRYPQTASVKHVRFRVFCGGGARLIGQCALAILFALAIAHPAIAEEGDYKLGPGDKLRLRVYEWRAPLDQVFEWKAFNEEFIVSGSGKVSLPLIGEVTAASRTTAELARTISQEIMKRMKLGEPPEAAVEVVEYRPFFIVGSVAKPGAYPYRPGLTVVQALSIAGGLPRPGDQGIMRLGREVISGRGEVQQLALQTNALLARRARLKAELKRSNEISFPPELLKRKNDPAIASLLDQEQIIFESRRTALKTQVSTLERLKAYLVKEVASLEEQIKLKQSELSIVEGELRGVMSLVKKGLSVASRQFALERLAAQLSSERLRLETTLLKAKQEISRTEVAIDEARNKNAIEVATQLRTTEAELEQTLGKYETQEKLLYESEVTIPRLLASRRHKSRETEPKYSIVRRGEDGKAEEFAATELTLVEPGDTIKVELPLPDDLTSILALPPRATQ